MRFSVRTRVGDGAQCYLAFRVPLQLTFTPNEEDGYAVGEYFTEEGGPHRIPDTGPDDFSSCLMPVVKPCGGFEEGGRGILQGGDGTFRDTGGQGLLRLFVCHLAQIDDRLRHHFLLLSVRAEDPDCKPLAAVDCFDPEQTFFCAPRQDLFF